MSPKAFWLSLAVYGLFGAGFAAVAVLKAMDRQPGPAAASAAGALYSFFRAAMVLRQGRRSTP